MKTDTYVKSYEDKDWLAEQLQTKTVRQIAKDKHVSYKLINKWGIVYGLIRQTEETKLP
jgi:hypothetical protein